MECYKNFDGLNIINIKNIDKNYILYELQDDNNNRIIVQREKVFHNVYNLSGEYGIGYTSKGEEFWFDLEDYDKIKDYCWSEHNGYMITYSLKLKKRILLHRLIMNAENTMVVDHINHNIIDNRKCNLRLVTSSQNAMNMKTPLNNTSGIKGVAWDKSRNKWMAYIKINGKNKNLGRYIDFEDAVNARKEAEEKYFGEYSYNIDI